MKLLRVMSLAAAFALSLVSSSRAQVYIAAAEDTSVTSSGAGTFYATTACTTNCRSNMAIRAELVVANGTSTSDPPTGRWVLPTLPSAESLIWVHAQVYLGSAVTSTANEQSLIVRSPDGVSRMLLRQSGTSGDYKISQRNAAGTITDLGSASSTPIVVNTLTQVDWEINYTCSGAGGSILYLNGTAVITFSGNPCTDAATTLNQVEFAGLQNGSAAGNCTSANSMTCYTEIIIAGQDTRGMSLYTCALQAAGNTQSWLPNTLANVNKATIADTTSVAVSTQPTLSEWTCPTSAPTGSYGVLGIEYNARMEVGTSGPQTFQFVARTNSTDYSLGSGISGTTSFANYQYFDALNPNGSVPWGLTGAGGVFDTSFNVGVISGP